MTAAIEAESAIEIVREECTDLPCGPTVIATGPLTSNPLSEAIQQELGDGGLSFFDAIAPIVHRDGLDENVVFAAGRFDQDADYLNCPMSEPEYLAFVEALRGSEGHQGHDWDTVPYFEGCLPIEVMASRGIDTLRFGPMKPIGLTDPQTGKRPWAVVQLRREDRAGQMWNLVGFQTRLKIGEQREIFKTIPGLSNAEFLRWGSIHRNSYLNFPGCLSSSGSSKQRTDLIFAGQLTGVEGYTESAASGIFAGINLGRSLCDQEPLIPPPTTMLGGLFRYLRDADPKHFQPMNSNWGLVDPLSKRIRSKRERRELLAQRANEDFLVWMQKNGLTMDRARASA
jgi:methylenetetrahydrofolate--tRNA-(uracil-5-)-methyltransferase